ncbi:MAG: BrnA antitoxin family protein [Thiomonas sp.]|uniref:BrnA antitoxin family protein n=1 Tax=Thiomonas sp. TaxID=2047785 RepID=UPI002A35C7B7|nr:BrnA antitoxin family protein [Thiomonas sp.]MDY0331453.1 BrnA antitoxin family protein [Thiomonas sp.]
MNGSKTNAMNRKALLDAVRQSPPEKDYVWDGLDDDERPASPEELRAGLAAARRTRGRPAGSGLKEQVAIRFDREVLDAFRASGSGWQTRMNAALKEWLKTHSLS